MTRSMRFSSSRFLAAMGLTAAMVFGTTACSGDTTDFLRELLPVDAKIKLMYDVERTDKDARILAAVFTSSDAFVSAEIARVGLGSAVTVGKNSTFLPPVHDEQISAATQSLDTAARPQRAPQQQQRPL